jgi:hypothetical protein
MKVDINRTEETRGLVFKKKDFVVTVTVHFTEEEKKVIELAKYGDYVLVERPPRAGVKDGKGLEDVFHLRVRHLLKGTPDKYEFEHIDDANKYQNELPEALKALKSLIENYADAPTSQSFEL